MPPFGQHETNLLPGLPWARQASIHAALRWCRSAAPPPWRRPELRRSWEAEKQSRVGVSPIGTIESTIESQRFLGTKLWSLEITGLCMHHACLDSKVLCELQVLLLSRIKTFDFCTNPMRLVTWKLITNRPDCLPTGFHHRGQVAILDNRAIRFGKQVRDDVPKQVRQSSPSALPLQSKSMTKM